MQIDVILYRSMPPLPSTEDAPRSAHNYCLDRDPLAEDSGSDPDDERTLADILRSKKSSINLVGRSPSQG